MAKASFDVRWTRHDTPTLRGAEGGTFELEAPAVLVTSGGIGGNPELVRSAWPERLGPPPRDMLAGVPALNLVLVGALAFMGGMVGVTLGWLAWFGAVEPLPNRMSPCTTCSGRTSMIPS